jgi:hypothetical protein
MDCIRRNARANEHGLLPSQPWQRRRFYGTITLTTRFRVIAMLDRDGYRPNVAIVIVNAKNQVFWGKRIREHSWQFPQGGINPRETP